MPESSIDLYVSPAGDDAWSGRHPDPTGDGRDGPFATLEAARDALRERRRSGAAGGATVWLRGWSYQREASFQLDAEDGGSEDAPVVYRAFPGEEVRLIGGRTVSGFRPIAGSGATAEAWQRLSPAARSHVLVADLRAQGISDYGTLEPAGFGRGRRPTALEVFHRDRRMTLARWPDHSFVNVARVDVPGRSGTDDVPWDASSDEPNRSFEYFGDRPRGWREPAEALVHGYWTYDWADSYQRIESIDLDARLITTDQPGAYGYTTGQRYYYLNVLEELDSPGEWYLDRRAGLLYFWPPGDPSPQEVAVTVSLLTEPVVALRGASHVRIRGITIECCRGDGIAISGGRDATVCCCEVRNTGEYGIRVEEGTGHRIERCGIHHTGAGGVSLAGGDRRTLTPGGHVVENCDIHHFSRLQLTYAPAVDLHGVGHRVAHNHLHDAPHTAVLLTGNDHVVELNEIDHVCTQTGDAGAFYMGRDWTERGNVVRHNFFHDLGIFGYGRHGVRAVYLDDCASGTTIYGNVFLRCTRAVLIGGGRDNRVQNNLFVHCEPAVQLDGRGQCLTEQWRDMVYNTMRPRLEEMNHHEPPYAERYPQLAELDAVYEAGEGFAPTGNVIANNLCYGGRWLLTLRDVDPHLLPDDGNLIGVDPGFADEPNDDLRLATGSLAYEAGMQAIPFGRIGPAAAIGPSVHNRS